MAITINGDGTISGVSVGGLPDGIVDTDMLASNAVTSALLPAGTILTAVSSQSHTRTSLGNTYRSAAQFSALDKSITRKQPNSSNIWVNLTLSIGVGANHWRAGIKYSYVSDFSTSTNLLYGSPNGHGLTWTSDQFYQYPFLSPLINDSGDGNTYTTVSGSVIFTPTSGQNTVWFRVYVWAENSTDTTMINGTLANNATHGAVNGSSLTLMEIAA